MSLEDLDIDEARETTSIGRYLDGMVNEFNFN